MANRQHLGLLLDGVDAWNQWRRDNPDVRPYLREADLSRTELGGADLTEAHLGQANFFSANLCGANLRGANLTGTDFCDTELYGADLTGAWIAKTRFVNVDLREVKGLDSVVHSGPSTIGIDTIYKSSGQIPPAFLRGCNVPEALITYIPSLVAAQSGIEYHSVFLCYSIEDHAFAERLSVDLEVNGFRCWFRPHHTDDGSTKDEQDFSIQMLDRQLLILSNHSIHSSWIRSEVEKTLLRGLNENRRIVYPVSTCSLEELEKWKTDPEPGKDYAREIREYFIPNFSNWHDSYAYDQVFAALLREFRSDPSAAPSCAAFESPIVEDVA
jgi:hypothetical protein